MGDFFIFTGKMLFMKAIEIKGEVKNGKLQLPDLNPFHLKGPVKVILLAPESEDIDEALWLHTASHHNEVFDFLNDPSEDIYSISDGKSFS